jgi:hypothetical protein
MKRAVRNASSWYVSAMLYRRHKFIVHTKGKAALNLSESHVTRHTPHATRHTSRVTRHTHTTKAMWLGMLPAATNISPLLK